MATGSKTLTEYPHELVRLVCDREDCDRAGQYPKRTPIDRYGPAIRLPDLLQEISADCPKSGGLGNDMCGARYFTSI
jgi:hypothetical protein